MMPCWFVEGYVRFELIHAASVIEPVMLREAESGTSTMSFPVVRRRLLWLPTGTGATVADTVGVVQVGPRVVVARRVGGHAHGGFIEGPVAHQVRDAQAHLLDRRRSRPGTAPEAREREDEQRQDEETE